MNIFRRNLRSFWAARLYFCLLIIFSFSLSVNANQRELSPAQREAQASKDAVAKLSKAQLEKLERVLKDEMQAAVSGQKRAKGQSKIVFVNRVNFDDRKEGLFLIIDLSRSYLPDVYSPSEMEGLLDEINSAAFSAASEFTPITGVDITFDNKPLLYYFPEEDLTIKKLRGELGLASAPAPIQCSTYESIIVDAGHGKYYNYNQKKWVYHIDPFNGITEDVITVDYANALLPLVDPYGTIFFSCNKTRAMGLLDASTHQPSGSPWPQLGARYDIQQLYPDRTDIWHSRPSDNTANRENSEDINSRPLFANSVGVKTLIHMHTNGGSPDSRGTQVYYHSGRIPDQKLGNDVLCAMKELIRAVPAYSSWSIETQARGVTNKGENTLATMPSIIVETAFHSNPNDAAALVDVNFRDAAVKGIAKGYKLNKAGKTCEPFVITGIPNASGPHNSSVPIQVSYKGYPTFPVKAKVDIVSCPGTCNSGEATFGSDTPSPLSYNFGCKSFISTSTVRIRTTLTDADGVKAAPVEHNVTCVVTPPGIKMIPVSASQGKAVPSSASAGH